MKRGRATHVIIHVKLRRYVQPRAITIGRIGLIAAIYALLGCVIGLVSGYLRPMIPGPVHYESLIAMGILTTLALALLFETEQLAWARALGLIATGLSVLIAAYGLGISIAFLFNYSYMINDFLGVAVGFWFFFICTDLLLLTVIRWLRPLRHGPYCPACSYCLVGVLKHECPECGRGFTLEELQISQADLHPAPNDIRRK